MPRDIGVVARDYTDANFIVYHSSIGAGSAFNALENFSGKLGAASVKGNLSLTRQGEQNLTGAVETETLDMQTLTAWMLGADERAATDPLAQGLIGWRGSVVMKAGKAALPGGMELAAVSGTMRGDGSSISFDDVKGTVGGGVTAGAAAGADAAGAIVVAAAPGRASWARALKASADTEARQTNAVARWPFMAVFPLRCPYG